MIESKTKCQEVVGVNIGGQKVQDGETTDVTPESNVYSSLGKEST